MEVGVSRCFSFRVKWIALVKEKLKLTSAHGHGLLKLMNLYNTRLIAKPRDSVSFGRDQSQQKVTELSVFPFKKISQKDGELQGQNLSVKEVSEGMAMIV